MPNIDLSQYYTPEEAAAKLSRNSGKRITTNYVRQLVVYGKITPVKIHSRLNVYPKAEIDRYIVEDPGKKSGRAKKKLADTKAKAKERKGTDTAAPDTQEASWWQKPDHS